MSRTHKQSKRIDSPWELLSALIEEATGMTGDEAVDYVRIQRGADLLRHFQREHPMAWAFIKCWISGTPDEALTALEAWKPGMGAVPMARTFLAGVQREYFQGSRAK